MWNQVPDLLRLCPRLFFELMDVQALLEGNTRGFMGNSECTPGYYNNEGGAIGRKEKLNGSGYPDGPMAYFRYIQQWRTSGEFEGLDFRPA